MATRRKSILNGSFMPDGSGKCYPAPISTQVTHANPKGQSVIVMEAPATAGDVGFEGDFKVPATYVDGSEKLIITGLYAGDPTSLASRWITTMLAVAASESIDQAYSSEMGVTESTWTGYADEDMIEMEIDISSIVFAQKDTVFFTFALDDTIDTQTAAFLLTDLEFEYLDA